MGGRVHVCYYLIMVICMKVGCKIGPWTGCRAHGNSVWATKEAVMSKVRTR